MKQVNEKEVYEDTLPAYKTIAGVNSVELYERDTRRLAFGQWYSEGGNTYKNATAEDDYNEEYTTETNDRYLKTKEKLYNLKQSGEMPKTLNGSGKKIQFLKQSNELRQSNEKYVLQNNLYKSRIQRINLDRIVYGLVENFKTLKYQEDKLENLINIENYVKKLLSLEEDCMFGKKSFPTKIPLEECGYKFRHIFKSLKDIKNEYNKYVVYLFNNKGEVRNLEKEYDAICEQKDAVEIEIDNCRKRKEEIKKEIEQIRKSISEYINSKKISFEEREELLNYFVGTEVDLDIRFGLTSMSLRYVSDQKYIEMYSDYSR